MKFGWLVGPVRINDKFQQKTGYIVLSEFYIIIQTDLLYSA